MGVRGDEHRHMICCAIPTPHSLLTLTHHLPPHLICCAMNSLAYGPYGAAMPRARHASLSSDSVRLSTPSWRIMRSSCLTWRM